MIKINELHTEESKKRFSETPILKFGSKTYNFSSLGYDSQKSFFVILENKEEWGIQTYTTTRELNKLVKEGINTINKLNEVQE